MRSVSEADAGNSVGFCVSRVCGSACAVAALLGHFLPRLGPHGSDAVRPLWLEMNSRANDPPWRAWYKTARWQRLRLEILIRDGYACAKTGVLCVGEYPSPNSAVADHIKPHRGDPNLFWDASNIQTVSKAYHDGQKQRDEQVSVHQRGVWY